MILLIINENLLDLTLILSDLDIYLLVYFSIEYDLVKIKTSKKGRRFLLISDVFFFYLCYLLQNSDIYQVIFIGPI